MPQSSTGSSSLALQASSGMVLGQTVNVKCPHAVSALMNQAKVTSVTSSRWGNWLATLTAPNIVIHMHQSRTHPHV